MYIGEPEPRTPSSRPIKSGYYYGVWEGFRQIPRASGTLALPHYVHFYKNGKVMIDNSRRNGTLDNYEWFGPVLGVIKK
jgi:hypothetical protein